MAANLTPLQLKRRWFQFRLWTLLIAVVMLGAPCAGVWIVAVSERTHAESTSYVDKVLDDSRYMLWQWGVVGDPDLRYLARYVVELFERDQEEIDRRQIGLKFSDD